MNHEELHALACDFRRLQSEMLDRSSQILSLFETALKRSAALQTSNEQFNYLDYGIRIKEGDYILIADRSQPLSEVSLFSESEKRQTAKSVGASHATDLNVRGTPANVSRSNTMTVAAATVLASSLDSNSVLSGGVVVAGGIGIGKNANVGGGLTVQGVMSAQGSLTVSGQFTVVSNAQFASAVDTLSVETGSVIVSGGVGIAKSVTVGGSLSLAG
ncbi:hypothetical protein HDU81_001193 [Chytriomyces hyalinus]|nr:hypothetical protein HDU81_001193 [Chytriomyces hyalinus]